MTYQRQILPQIEKQLSLTTGPASLEHGRVLDTIGHHVGKLFAHIAAWNHRQAGAARLKRLNAHMRADIGLPQADADGAGRQRYWFCW